MNKLSCRILCNKGKYVKEHWKTKIGNGKCEKNLKKDIGKTETEKESTNREY